MVAWCFHEGADSILPWSPGTSCTYGWTMAPSICGGMNFVSPLKAMGLRINLRLNALASSLLRSPPGVCLWSSHHTTRPLRGTLAMAEASSRLPYCWPSSLRATSTSDIHRATGLYGCVHSWWKPPPQPMITCLVRNTVLRNPGAHLASFCWQGLFPAQWHPPACQIFLPARVEAGEIQYVWRRHAPQRSLWLPPWPSRLGPSQISQQSWQQQHGFSQPQRLHWWDNPFVLPRWTAPKQ